MPCIAQTTRLLQFTLLLHVAVDPVNTVYCIRAGHMSDHLTIYTIFCIPDDTPWTHFGPPSFTIDFCMPESAHTSTQSVQPSAARSTTSC
ncbi:hypothetical protein PF005_g32475 [Phytophthora fragariae]|uniref:Secreted protein n=1 Tax=Phytophthora fragariae TaxID=53985 RepID=A0A6A3PLI3_9STRA|nr:hypothetical protein PF003_g26042 [Phytophthora fragariae]KAE8917102.1 hypothetical protein PF009_g32577 [Phytophthora fragariae]KAE9056198.1 hypothetical protein PF007_g32071 [Phytophthora fragariae]KAE9060914.1 hypothetical protein PF006_g31529 [Phytophthora fragariae]KAE9158381.1 hypothetical protein PF005_g32475 [Phytophthora fragariae]